MPRLKHVLSNPYTLFASQEYAQYGPSENWARNSQGNRSFNGTIAKSYAAIIARLFTNSKGMTLCLINSRDYSVTTSRHKMEVRSALGYSILAVEVPILSVEVDTDRSYASEHDVNLKHLWSHYQDAKEKGTRARSDSMKYVHQRRVVNTLTAIMAYTSFFGLSRGYRTVSKSLFNKEAETLADMGDRS